MITKKILMDYIQVVDDANLDLYRELDKEKKRITALEARILKLELGKAAQCGCKEKCCKPKPSGQKVTIRCKTAKKLDESIKAQVKKGLELVEKKQDKTGMHIAILSK